MSLFSALYTTPGEQSPLPSFFDLLLVDRMRAAVRPAFEHLLFVLWQRMPSLLSPAMRWKDEVFGALMYVLERWSLSRSGASFAEAFHGLQRKRAVVADDGRAPLLAASLGSSLLATIADSTAASAARAAATASPSAAVAAAGAAVLRDLSAATVAAATTKVGKFGTRHEEFVAHEDRTVSMVCLVALPYLWHKLGAYCSALALQEEEERRLSSSSTLSTSSAPRRSDSGASSSREPSPISRASTDGGERLRELVHRLRAVQWRALFRQCLLVALVHGFPLVDSLARLLSLVFQIRYLLGRTEFASPLLKLCGLVLVRRIPPQLGVGKAAEAAAASSGGRVAEVAGTGTRLAAYGLAAAQFLWTASLMALKVFEWFTVNNSNGELMIAGAGRDGRAGGSLGARATGAVAALRPPQDEGTSSQVSSATASSACPICNRDPVVNPAATYTGHVFCYTCVVPHVKENNTCPVTGVPCTENQIRRLLV